MTSPRKDSLRGESFPNDLSKIGIAKKKEITFSFNDKNSQGHGIHRWTWVNNEPIGVKDVASGLRKCVW